VEVVLGFLLGQRWVGNGLVLVLSLYFLFFQFKFHLDLKSG
jgi:hypothetical protein